MQHSQYGHTCTNLIIAFIYIFMYVRLWCYPQIYFVLQRITAVCFMCCTFICCMWLCVCALWKIAALKVNLPHLNWIRNEFCWRCCEAHLYMGHFRWSEYPEAKIHTYASRYIHMYVRITSVFKDSYVKYKLGLFERPNPISIAIYDASYFRRRIIKFDTSRFLFNKINNSSRMKLTINIYIVSHPT